MVRRTQAASCWQGGGSRARPSCRQGSCRQGSARLCLARRRQHPASIMCPGSQLSPPRIGRFPSPPVFVIDKSRLDIRLEVVVALFLSLCSEWGWEGVEGAALMRGWETARHHPRGAGRCRARWALPVGLGSAAGCCAGSGTDKRAACPCARRSCPAACRSRAVHHPKPSAHQQLLGANAAAAARHLREGGWAAAPGRASQSPCLLFRRLKRLAGLA